MRDEIETCGVCGKAIDVVIGADGAERYDAAISGGILACRACLGDAAAELLPRPSRWSRMVEYLDANGVVVGRLNWTEAPDSEGRLVAIGGGIVDEARIARTLVTDSLEGELELDDDVHPDWVDEALDINRAAKSYGVPIDVVDAEADDGERALTEGAFVARFPHADVMLYSDQWGDPERVVIVRQGGAR